MGRTACTEPQCLYKGALSLTFSSLQLVLSGDMSTFGVVLYTRTNVYLHEYSTLMIVTQGSSERSVYLTRLYGATYQWTVVVRRGVPMCGLL